MEKTNRESLEETKKTWWQWLLIYPTLVISLVGSIPTVVSLYIAYQRGIPVNAVAATTEQDDLWKKNFECSKKQEFHSIKTEDNVSVGALVCPSGDILLRVKPPHSPDDKLRWVGLRTFGVPLAVNGIFVRNAMAADWNLEAAQTQAPVVICQKWLGEGRILRRVQSPTGQCTDEIINTFTGVVVSRKPAACDSNC